MLVNHTIANLSGGVTQVFDELANEVDVREMINCIPSTSRGVLRRNPIKDSVKLFNDLTNRDYFTYSYDRGTGEQYIILVGNGEIAVFNATTKANIMRSTNAYLNIPLYVSPKEAFSLVTINDFTFVVNKYVKVLASASLDGAIDDHKKTGIYFIKRTSQNTVASTSEPVTVGSTTYFNGKQGTLIEGYKYNLNGYTLQAQRDTRYTANTQLFLSEDIVTEMAYRLNIYYTNGGTGYTTYSGTLLTPHKTIGPLLYRKNMNVNDSWTYSDSFGNEASYGFKGVVERPDQLPATMPADLIGTVVNITQSTSDSIDDYWLKYTGETWIESRKPGMANTLSTNTMPHVLVRGASGEFSFVEYTTSALSSIGILGSLGWKSREVGDEESNKMPSFVNDYITQVFFHKNRLGFISKDNIILSENSNYGNFFRTSVRILPETDPIDITIASTEVSYLNYVVPTNNALIMFGSNAQYVLHSGTQSLTPLTATIDVSSKYNMITKVSPKALGNKVFFVSENAGYSQLFLYNVTEGYANTESVLLTERLPSYIPKNVQILTGNSALGYIFMWSPLTASTIYVYNYNISGSKWTQSAFHKWTFERDVVGINILTNKVHITFIDGSTDDIAIGDLSLELPVDITSEIYMDDLAIIEADYESSLEFTKWFIKDGSGNGSKRGRLQLRSIEYSIDPSSAFSTYIVTNDGTISEATGIWDDDLLWDDTVMWIDSVQFYTSIIDNNPKVTVLGNTKDTIIVFKNDRLNVHKGFAIETLNFEGFYYQQSSRI